ncbi:basic proline-rich protein-like [Lontra canadensis]|uniref:basic proline-rich protein-like n=1 Tax=Lontra canadensis TaxID=76717 RepID=UPI0013F390C2|nr:basic proline-rich protein-like [Lontra canadensis]
MLASGARLRATRQGGRHFPGGADTKPRRSPVPDYSEPSSDFTPGQGARRGCRGAGLRDDCGGAEPRRAPDTAAGTRPVGAGQSWDWGGWGSPAKLPAEGPPRRRRGDWPGGRLRREGAGAELRGRGCCGPAGCPGCAAEAGRRRPPRLGLTKRKQSSPSARSPGTGTRPEGSRATALGPRGEPSEEEALPAWVPPPRADPGVFRSRRPGGLLTPHRAPSPAPLPPHSPGATVRSAAVSGSSLLSWDEAPRPPESPGLVRPWPWPRLSLVGPLRQSLGIAPPLEQSALPVGPECPSFLGPALIPGLLPLPLGPAPSLVHPPPLPLPSASLPTPPRSRRPRESSRSSLRP